MIDCHSRRILNKETSLIRLPKETRLYGSQLILLDVTLFRTSGNDQCSANQIVSAAIPRVFWLRATSLHHHFLAFLFFFCINHSSSSLIIILTVVAFYPHLSWINRTRYKYLFTTSILGSQLWLIQRYPKLVIKVRRDKYHFHAFKHFFVTNIACYPHLMIASSTFHSPELFHETLVLSVYCIL